METRGRRGPNPRRAGRSRWLLAVVGTLLLSTFVLAANGDAATGYDAEELQFLRLVNEYRAQNGLRPVLLSDTLTVAAERHSGDMAEYGFFAHDTERSSRYPAGSEPWDRMEAEGYDYNTAKGENLAVGYETAEEAIQAWKESPSHNAAMLDGGYRVMGVSRLNAPGSVHGWYWTTDFGGFVDPSAHAAGESPEGDSGKPQPQQPQPQRPAPEASPAPPEGTPEPPAEPAVVPEAPAPDTGALDDGRMRGIGGWGQTARDGAGLILDDRARLGGYHRGEDVLRQRVRVVPGASLVYDVKVKAGDTDPDDGLVVRLTDGEGREIAVLGRHDGTSTSGWQRRRADLSRYAGRTLYLSFHARTDARLLSTFYLDDLTLRRP